MVVLKRGMGGLFVFVLALQANGSFAQSSIKSAVSHPSFTNTFTSPPIEDLIVGDAVPDVQFKVLNFSRSQVKLSDFAGKLVILDFWATWCSACISKFKQLEKLQEKYADHIQILLVNSNGSGDTKSKITEFVYKWNNNSSENFSLPIVYEDTIAAKLFPHREVPHYVWINGDGRVVGITASSQVTEQNIQQLISGENIHLREKKDFSSQKVFSLLSNIPTSRLSFYSMFVKGKIDHLGVINQFVYDGNVPRGRVIRNTPILSIYRLAVALLKGSPFDKKRIILEVKDSSSLFRNPKINRDSWEADNLYTYDLIVPTMDANKLGEYMLKDLNHYSDYYGKFEKRKIKCLALTRTSKVDKIGSKGGKRVDNLDKKESPGLKNAMISDLINYWNRELDHIPRYFVDKTQYTNKIDISFPSELKTVNEWRKALRRYDLDLVEEECELEVFVLTSKYEVK